MKNKNLLSIFVLIFFVGFVLAIPPAPHAFNGRLVYADGTDVSGELEARIGGDNFFGQIKSSQYSLTVESSNSDRKIEFYFEEEKIGEADFKNFGVTELDFVVSLPPPASQNNPETNNPSSITFSSSGTSEEDLFLLCEPNWKCGVWAACSNGAKTRSCYDANSCDYGYGKPSESSNCQAENMNQTSKEKGDFVKVLIWANSIIVIILILVLVGLLIR
jgi:hypothetical protein